METVLAVLAVCVVIIGAVVVVVRRGVAAARRRVSAMRERAGLTARSYAGGPAGEVARLRRGMDRSLSSCRRALATARSVQAPVGDVPSLLGRLDLAASAVDAELRLLEAQPDRARVAAALCGPRSRAEAVLSSAATLIEGLLHATGYDADNLSVLQAECAIEAEGLRATSLRATPDMLRAAPSTIPRRDGR